MSPLTPAFIKAGVVAGSCILGGTVLLWFEIAKCERPKYSVVKKLKGKSTGGAVVQLRVYAPYIVAQVQIEGSLDDALNKGFNSIAKYIFGENLKPEVTNGFEKALEKEEAKKKMQKGGSKIAMTAPVRAELMGKDQHKISFIMPSKFSMENVPTPKNGNVKLIQVPGHTVAALKFKGGSPSQKKVDNKAGILRQVLHENGFQLQGDLMLYQYHPPFWPGFLRENEVLYAVDYNE